MNHSTGLILSLAVALAVYADARALGVRPKLLAGVGSLGPLGWAIYQFWMPLIALPTYLVYRRRYRRIHLGQESLPEVRTGAWKSVTLAVVLNALVVYLVLGTLYELQRHAPSRAAAHAMAQMPSLSAKSLPPGASESLSPKKPPHSGGASPSF